jgi:hypothetical protein
MIVQTRLEDDPVIVEPTHQAIQPPVRDERSMFVLELAVAGMSILVSLLLSLAR